MIRSVTNFLKFTVCFCFSTVACAQVVSIGEGVLRIGSKPSDNKPAAAEYRTVDMSKLAVPTNSWFSSLMYERWSGVLHAHPLSFKATESGFEVGRPSPSPQGIAGIKAWGAPPKPSDPIKGVIFSHRADLTISPLDFQPADARLAEKGDWNISVEMAEESGDEFVKARIAHGSPFAYFEGSTDRIKISLGDMGSFRELIMDVDSGEMGSLALPIEVDGKVYAVFAPRGSKFEVDQSTNSATLKLSAVQRFFSIGALPNNTPEILAKFADHAFAFVVNTRVDWEYDPEASSITSRYLSETKAMLGQEQDPIIGLYPHHYKHQVDSEPSDIGSIPSVRGAIKLLASQGFTTRLRFTGLLPVWPNGASGDDERKLGEYLLGDYRWAPRSFSRQGNGTYWGGKGLGYVAQLIGIAEQLGDEEMAERLEGILKTRFEKWFTGSSGFYFAYDKNVGSVLGFPDEFFSVSAMNDHHFHYGYWIMAAAQIARRDPEWASQEKWGGMVNLLVRDIATYERDRDDFPFVRNFDPYEGHSWARGNSQFFGHGNDQESSSEAIHAWAAVMLWGHFTGDDNLRNLGAYLYATEASSVLQYWFNIDNDVFHPEYPKPIASMVFGGAYGYSTWWTEDPRQTHGINLLPITSASVYLAQLSQERVLSDIAFMNEARAEYERVGITDGTQSDIWQDIFASWVALYDPHMALRMWNPSGPNELGDGKARTYYWLKTLGQFGTPRLDITADTPTFGVFDKDGVLQYCGYNKDSQEKQITFSDGTNFVMRPNQLSCYLSE